MSKSFTEVGEVDPTVDRHIKIIATIGPSSRSVEVVRGMVRSGVDGFRLNFSHGTLEEKEEEIEVIRDVEREEGHPLPIIGDLQGPAVRLGEFEPVSLSRGSTFTLSRDGSEGIPVPYDDFFKLVERGDMVLFEGGRIAARTLEAAGGKVVAEALVEGTLKPRKTVAIRGKEFDLPSITEKDGRDLEFAMKEDLEYIALSFTRSKEDVKELRDRLEEADSGSWIIAKIETIPGVENVDSIAEEADALLVARGDLGAKFPLETIPTLQMRIIEAAIRHGKPSIVATQLLDSMMENPIPTRSEVVDVYTAVRDGADALLLTGETAIGRHPVESAEWTNRIASYSERGYGPRRLAEGDTVYDRFALGVVELAEAIDAKIAAYTRGGFTARRLSRYRPRIPLNVFAPTLETLRKVALLWGARPAALVKGEVDLKGLADIAVENGIADKGDRLVLVRGRLEETTDVVRIEIL